jgi:hypothetical protein
LTAEIEPASYHQFSHSLTSKADKPIKEVMVAAPTAPAVAAGSATNEIAVSNGTAPIKDEFVAKLTAREALKETNQKYWEDDPYSECSNDRSFLLYPSISPWSLG